ncbi:endonuclease MutS2 [Leptolyngbya ohadii]|uniref:endonuclease MutS2 n=1 Tax=Leptolyngbya ohadii TaxID=1962290 RepID=UPI000B59F57C|nr:endonuclease MutS2 [Leptolyngbya ohadii]
MIQAETLELLEWSRLCQHLATFAATKLGKTAATQLPIPETIAQSQILLDQTKEVYQLETLVTGGLSFEGVQDIGDSLERAGLRGILAGQELLDIATTLNGARQIRRVIDNQPDLTVLNDLVADLRTYPEIEQEIHRCIDDRGKVTDRANPKLAGIREQIRSTRDRIYEVLHRTLQRQSNAIQEPLITQRGDRFVIPVKASHKDVIPGVVHDTSTSGMTLYVEPHSIVNQGNQLRQLVRQEQREEEEVRRILTEQIAEVQEDLERLLAIVTTLDLATARARYSYWLGANPPRFMEFTGQESSNSEQITLRQLRHPLLIWQQQHEQGAAVVPIDLVIQPRLRVVAITGPNTGGKTVTLKTLGLAALMAKVGLFVPAREPVEIPWFDQILADIGDEQSLQQSLSTFSGHIRRISRILEAIGTNTLQKNSPSQESTKDTQSESENQSPPELGDLGGDAGDNAENNRSPEPLTQTPLANALILLDEVGAGTDPSEGSALAIALLNHLAAHAALTIATTHFGELKALKYQDDRFENASVEFDDVSLSPTYRLLWGIPGRSNALTIAKRLGLNPQVVEAAQNQVGMGATAEVNEVIAGLEAQRRQQEEKAKAAQQLVTETERLYREVSRKAEMLQNRERELQAQQEQAVQQAIAQAKGEIAQVIRRLQKGTPTGQDAQRATDAINQIAAERLPSRQAPPKPKPGFRPKVGDRVRIPRLGQTAEVLTAPNDDNELQVRFGLMKMTVTLADVESLQGEKAEMLQNRERELQAQQEQAVQQAIGRAEAGPLWIIHGHGTGKLRQGIQEFLKRHPQVESFEFADRADGGTGVTVAQIR